MKRKLIAIAILFVISLSCLTIAACEVTEEFGSWSETKAATCTENGLEERFCLTHNGQHREEREIPALDHDLTQWKVVQAPTLDDGGVKRRDCQRCDYYEQEPIDPIPVKYTITIVDGIKVVSRVKVAEDGNYSLTAPQKIGYSFEGYFDEQDNKYELVGKVEQDVTISARWSLDETKTFEQLSLYARSGTDKIHITENIEITDTVYIVSDTEIFVDGHVTLTRGAGFTGDMFVLGENEKGDSVLNLGQSASLTLTAKQPQSSSLIINGNGSDINADGSAILLLNSSTLNVYDGVTITDCKKTSNSKLNSGKYLISYPDRIGGAAVCVANGEFNMYGGEISYCEINLDENNSSESDENLRTSSCGGAIYNYGTTNIYGGAIHNNKAARGGAIYNYRDIGIFSADLHDNYASVYGGAIYLSGSQYAKTTIGNDNSDLTKISVVFENNTSQKSGGALFGQTLNSISINGETLFKNNESLDNNGGAINTSGSLIVKNASFESNRAQSKGGAIYAYYSNPDRTVRLVDVANVMFENNSASKGGAIAVSASKDNFDKGGICALSNAVFVGNNAFATSADDSEVSDSEQSVVSGDAATDEKNFNGNGGAIYVSRKGKLTADNCLFESNSSERRGGAIYSTGNSEIEFAEENIFVSNSSVRGGALFVYDNSAVTAAKVGFVKNSASERGGAVYVSSSVVKFDEVVAEDNEISVKDLQQEIDQDGNPVFDDKGNPKYDDTERSGGVLSAYSQSEVTIKKLTAENNVATGNGGVVYASDSVITLSDVIANGNSSLFSNGGVFAIHSAALVKIDGISANGNSAAEGNGGVAYVRSSQIVIGAKDSVKTNVLSNNTASGGGALYASVADNKIDPSVINIKIYSLTVEGSSAENNGGAIYIYSNAVADIGNLTANNNISNGKNGGGAMYISGGAIVNLSDCTFTSNRSAANGGAIAIYADSIVTMTNISASENTAATYGGVIYVTGAADLSIENVVAHKNTAQSGGFLYITTTNTILRLYSGDISDNAAASVDNGNAIWSNTAKVKLCIKGGASGYGQYLTCDVNDIKGKASIIDIPTE